MVEYTAVCIGGGQDGRLVTSNRSHLQFMKSPPPSPAVWPAGVGEQPEAMKFESEWYRTEQFDLGDKNRPETLLIAGEVSTREAFGLLLDCYTGRWGWC